MVIKQREGHKDLTLDLDKLPLGKKITYPEKYDPSLLVGISREESRNRSGVTLEPNSFYGLDSWTAYELSWLNLDGIPKNAVLYASYESSSKNFIESKSLKLYLNSLNNKKFNSLGDLLALIKHDLKQCVSSEVEIEIKNTPKDFVKESKSIDLVEINSEEGVEEDRPWVSADEASEELSNTFELGNVKHVVVEGNTVKLLSFTVGENKVSVFMEKDVNHNRFFCPKQCNFANR